MAAIRPFWVKSTLKFNKSSPPQKKIARNTTRFHENRLKIFRVVLFTDKQTNKQTGGGNYITSLADIINRHLRVVWMATCK